MSTATSDAAETSATADDACYRCGYALRGIADDQPCPECGLLAERSRRQTDELHHTRPGWLRRLSWGVWLILLAMGLTVLWPFAATLFQQQLMASYAGMSSTSRAYSLWLHGIWFGGDFAVMVLLAGVWLLTTREGYAPADGADAWRRRLLRFVAFAPLAALGLMHLTSQLSAIANATPRPVGSSYDEPMNGPLPIVAFCLVTVGSIPFPILLYLQLRSLAKRARSAHLAEHCLIVGVGNALTLLYIPLFALLINYGERWGFGYNWSGRSTVSLLLSLVLAVSSLLFLLWNVYLLIRFAIAFAVVSGKLRRAWRLADRSTAW